MRRERLLADMVMETTVTQGVGAVLLAGPVDGWLAFADRFADGATVWYGRRVEGGDFEVCVGVLHHGPPAVIERSSVISSSAGGAAVAWGEQEQRVYSTLPADEARFNDEDVSSVAAAGATQGAATLVGFGIAEVAPVAAGQGVRLPPAESGRELAVHNRGANALKVYPASGERIDALAVDAALSLAAGGAVILSAVGSRWYSQVGA